MMKDYCYKTFFRTFNPKTEFLNTTTSLRAEIKTLSMNLAGKTFGFPTHHALKPKCVLCAVLCAAVQLLLQSRFTLVLEKLPRVSYDHG